MRAGRIGWQLAHRGPPASLSSILCSTEMIPDYIERWLSDPVYGVDEQDFDLSLADVEFLPRLKAYLSDAAAPDFKKAEVVSALLELLEHDCPQDGGAEAARLAEDIKHTVRQHTEIAHRAMSELDPIK